MPSIFALTSPSSMVEGEKENKNQENQIGTSPPTSSTSLFKNVNFNPAFYFMFSIQFLAFK
jgi:hypothetical protein